MDIQDLPEPDDDAIRRGDPDAFTALYIRYAPRVLGYLLRLGVARQDAEDLTQETFLAALRGSGRFGGRSRPLAWLLGIAVRRWRDGNRRGPAPKQVSVEPGPDTAKQALRKVTLEHSLLQLDEPLREALLLVVVQGLSYAEAAGALAIPLGTLKWRLHEATRRMRRLLSEGEELPHEP
ncbi:RNA polymerase sigma factor [Armatimonas rosea]|uniref:RNA polymerase sigma factor n=1 Tax=Armatimonas rosea TaxID=685828 RepID=A0A7W9W8U4_ARMRO|nr:RNA polymerase sigma factor [Armatimonas rosea]MBB6052500.1 RNA polymerase sigma-70 factor (ECF subfamily) [Armatimonas rosea]